MASAPVVRGCVEVCGLIIPEILTRPRMLPPPGDEFEPLVDIQLRDYCRIYNSVPLQNPCVYQVLAEIQIEFQPDVRLLAVLENMFSNERFMLYRYTDAQRLASEPFIRRIWDTICSHARMEP